MYIYFIEIFFFAEMQCLKASTRALKPVRMKERPEQYLLYKCCHLSVASVLQAASSDFCCPVI